MDKKGQKGRVPGWGLGRLVEMQVLRLRAPRSARRTSLRRTGLWMVVMLLASAAAGQVPAAAGDIGLRKVSRAEYGAELVRMGGVVGTCRVRTSACDAKAVPADETVGAEEGKVAFGVHWDWLRESLKKAGVAADKDRETALDSAAGRLGQEVAELRGAGPAASGPDAPDARRKMTAVLGRREFGTVRETRWWQRILVKLGDRFEDWLNRVGEVVPWSPWMGLVLEWGVLGAAAVGMILWALRLSKQQRVAFAADREPAPAWQAESDDWAAKAKAEAAKGEWREAVHCLYWSAIVMLEGQKLWRQNRARTPREYVGLLEPGSARRRVLGGLTGVFERIWYGIRPATGEDYQKASALLDELRVG